MHVCMHARCLFAPASRQMSNLLCRRGSARRHPALAEHISCVPKRQQGPVQAPRHGTALPALHYLEGRTASCIACHCVMSAVGAPLRCALCTAAALLALLCCAARFAPPPPPPAGGGAQQQLCWQPAGAARAAGAAGAHQHQVRACAARRRCLRERPAGWPSKRISQAVLCTRQRVQLKLPSNPTAEPHTATGRHLAWAGMESRRMLQHTACLFIATTRSAVNNRPPSLCRSLYIT